ncbi:MAG: hypothetical protein A6F72_00780 [Cycloclasticus sp. symbiont of Poecilosclerida sp. N]|nr:MAG: hypothetical protein A6F72_00780 [Cycloclasticus sp. symbiont of Poecilosclerida sp. N]
MADCAVGCFLDMGQGDEADIIYFRKRIFPESEGYLSEVLDTGISMGCLVLKARLFRLHVLCGSLWKAVFYK